MSDSVAMGKGLGVGADAGGDGFILGLRGSPLLGWWACLAYW